MIGKHSKLTTSLTQPPVANAPAGSNTAAAAAPEVNLSTVDLKRNMLFDPSTPHDVFSTISDYDPRFLLLNRHASDSRQEAGDGIRNRTITKKLLSAVAYGLESREVNVDTKPKDLFAKDLLKKSPEFLLRRAHLTDWAGRTFKGRITKAHPHGKGITAFEYALWAKDFKMLEMMLGCTPATAEGDKIRAGLLKQYEQVTAPIYAGGGLTYELTYDKPTMDNGIPMKGAAGVRRTTSVTEVHTENHFDVTPLLRAYKDYNLKFNAPEWTRAEHDACWVKIIGTLQSLLPIHILQRFCDPDTPFVPLPSFTGVFKRTTQFSKSYRRESLLSSTLSIDFFLLLRSEGRGCQGVAECESPMQTDLGFVRRLNNVSTCEIKTKIRPLLAVPALRNKMITKKLLSAVANGMESATVNINPETHNVVFKEVQDRAVQDRRVTEASKAKFKESKLHNEVLTNEEQGVADLIELLFAEDLLAKSPEFLLERGDIKDWGGRTFKNITAFEYALWAKDFKMLEMMLHCIPATEEGDRIRAGLLEQYEQVTAPICAGGGLTYELTYNQPKMNKGIPMKDVADAEDAKGVWRTTSVTEVHTENHFDVTPLLTAYQDYNDKFNTPGRRWSARDACWVKIIGTLQRLLPIHILQRFCDPNTPFVPQPSFTGVFKRTTQFSISTREESLLSSSLSTDFSLLLYPDGRGCQGVAGGVSPTRLDLLIVRRVDKVSTREIETKIRPQLAVPAQSQTQFHP